MTEAEALADPAVATRGFVGQLLRRLAIATGENTNARIQKATAPLLARIKAQESRIERQAQLLSAMSKEIAALTRKQQ
jgi:hypothetical protein